MDELHRALNQNQEVFRDLEDFVRNASPQLSVIWAKSGDETGFLSLPQHLADTASVAAVLWDFWVAKSVKLWVASKLGMSEDEAKRLLIFLAGVHDVGKATKTFVRQIEKRELGAPLVDAIADAGLPLKLGALEGVQDKFLHGLSGYVLVRNWLLAQGARKSASTALASTVGAHHGLPVTDQINVAEDILADYEEPWKRVHTEVLDAMAKVARLDRTRLKALKKPYADVLMQLTGLVVMTDWIASNADAFSMGHDVRLCDRAQKDRVEYGLEVTGLTGCWKVRKLPDIDADSFYRESFGWPGEFAARPVQKVAFVASAQVDRPTLFIVEAPTGEGKTEAALAIAGRIAAQVSSQGLLLATPTMGTSNGLFSRALDWSQRNTAMGTTASMNLVHSRRQFSEEFYEFRSSDIGRDDSDEYGAVVARQWFNGAKKALLSNFVVCTVDQVLMLALQVRYGMLRHLALAGKVIIIDEVHSYDVYMSSYLQRALQWLKRYQASVILLSATLPYEQKIELLKSYNPDPEEFVGRETAEQYPLITTATGEKISLHSVDSSPTELDASIEIMDDGVDQLEKKIKELSAEGGCLLIICNTIQRAQAVAQLAEQLYPGKVELHHSAFMASERAQREDALRASLGPKAHRGSGRPDHKIIVATQVAEQSLDIDADVLITDIAPMDLLIQRIGRLHRHKRDDSDRPEILRKPQVYVRAVLVEAPVPEFESGATAVYEPKVLAATLACLPTRFRRPDHVAPLVQRTYGAGVPIPNSWQEQYNIWEQESKRRNQTSSKRSENFQIPDPHHASRLNDIFGAFTNVQRDGVSEENGQAQVRDADPMIEVIPIISVGEQYAPVPINGASPEIWLDDDAPLEYRTAYQLASSILRLPGRLTRHQRLFDQVITQLELDTPVAWQQNFLLKGKVALRLDVNWEKELQGYFLRYSSRYGLEVKKN